MSCDEATQRPDGSDKRVVKALSTVATIIALTAAPLFAETRQDRSAIASSEQEVSESAQACAGKVAETGKPDPDDASKADQKSGTSQSGSSDGRMFGVLPNYSTVEKASIKTRDTSSAAPEDFSAASRTRPPAA